MIYYIAINTVTLFAFLYDKLSAQKKAWRVKESPLLWLIVLGGSFGALIGMKLFRHKTKKPKFIYGTSAFVIIHALLIYKFII